MSHRADMMEEKKLNGSRWVHPKTGEVRFYLTVEESAEIGGLEVDRYKTGNICSSYLDGEKISHAEAGRILRDVDKIYYTEDGKVHIKSSGHDLDYQKFWTEVSKRIEAQLKGTRTKQEMDL